MRMLADFFKRRSITKYGSKLCRQLAMDHGKSGYYSVNQIEETLSRNRYAGPHLMYAIAMFCTADAYKKYSKEHGIALDYDAARVTIGEVLFKARKDYAQSELPVVIMQSGGGSGESSESCGDGGGADH